VAAIARKTFLDAWSAGLARFANDELPPLAIIAGEAPFVKERLLDAAYARVDGQVEVFAARPGEKDAQALRRLLDLWNTSTLFGGPQLVVARAVDTLLKGKGVQALEAALAQGAPPNRLLLTVSHLDGRSKLAKRLKATQGLVSLPALRDAPPPWHTGGPFLETDLNCWIVAEARAQGLTVPLAVADELARRIGNEPGRLAQKLSQLGVLLEQRDTLTVADVEQYVTYSSVRLLARYEDAVLAGRQDEALDLVDRMTREGVYDPFMRLVTGPAVGETVLRGLTSNLARVYQAHERLGPQLVAALSSKPWERSKPVSAALDEALGKGGPRVFLERDLRRITLRAAQAAFPLALQGLRRLRDGRGLSLHAHTVRLAQACTPPSTGQGRPRW
jgi:DNA polymerase III delta subunit